MPVIINGRTRFPTSSPGFPINPGGWIPKGQSRSSGLMTLGSNGLLSWFWDSSDDVTTDVGTAGDPCNPFFMSFNASQCAAKSGGGGGVTTKVLEAGKAALPFLCTFLSKGCPSTLPGTYVPLTPPPWYASMGGMLAIGLVAIGAGAGAYVLLKD